MVTSLILALSLASSPTDFSASMATVWIFAGTECPISNSYAPEYKRLVASFEPKGVKFFLVYPDQDVTKEEIEKHRKQFGLSMEGLKDDGLKLAKQAHASHTPEAAVFNPKGELLYHGRIDNRWYKLGRPRSKATTHELADSLTQMLAGHSPKVSYAKPVGCSFN